MSTPTHMATIGSSSTGTRSVTLGAPDMVLETRADGSFRARSPHPLPPFAPNIAAKLFAWAARHPERLLFAERPNAGEGWRSVTYGAAARAVRAIGQGLLDRGLTVERPVMILSGNGLDHALLALGCLSVGIPYAPISTAYSLISTDFAKLREIYARLTPGLVFVDNGPAYANAIQAVIGPAVEIVSAGGPVPKRPTTAFADLLRTEPGPGVDAALAALDADTIAKFLFTSGSTGHPKGVINTQRVICSNQELIRSAFTFLQETPPVIVDWLPWSHTFGGNHNFNMAIYNGGSFYIDGGKPTPAGIAETVRNLKEISPTLYFNVPKGYESLIPFFESDKALRDRFYSQVKMLFFAGASMAQWVWDRFDAFALETVGEKIQWMSGLGSTETGPGALYCRPDVCYSGVVGLPVPGVELKLLPNAGKLEARVRGPAITPGYWRQPELTAKAFDEEGFYLLGDALKFVDPDDPGKGFLFDGRVAEDFKLSSGTWVSVGPLRARIVQDFAPVIRDCVIAGHNQDDVRILIFPDLEACRALLPGHEPLPAETICADPRVRAVFAHRLAILAQSATGSANRVAAALLLADPPAIDRHEITDKGSLNQRATLESRAANVAALFTDPPADNVIFPELARSLPERTVA